MTISRYCIGTHLPEDHESDAQHTQPTHRPRCTFRTAEATVGLPKVRVHVPLDRIRTLSADLPLGTDSKVTQSVQDKLVAAGHDSWRRHQGTKN
jgi:hypothetical protein